jgi:uncharacterized membrane protein
MTPITLRTLQIGGVFLCIIAVVIAATVFPTLAPPTFLIACSVMLVIAMYINRSEFGVDQYERNTLKYTLRNSASLIVFLILVLGIVGFFYFSQHNSSMIGPAPSLPSLPTIGGGLTSVAKHAVSRIKEVMRTGNLGA